MNRTKIPIVVAFLSVITAGCMSTTKDETVSTPVSTLAPTPTPVPMPMPTAVISTLHTETVQGMVFLKFHDDKQNVTCYVFRKEIDRLGGYNHGRGIGIGVGVSCIPDWQLTPPQTSNDCNCS